MFIWDFTLWGRSEKISYSEPVMRQDSLNLFNLFCFRLQKTCGVGDWISKKHPTQLLFWKLSLNTACFLPLRKWPGAETVIFKTVWPVPRNVQSFSTRLVSFFSIFFLGGGLWFSFLIFNIWVYLCTFPKKTNWSSDTKWIMLYFSSCLDGGNVPVETWVKPFASI